MVLGADQYIECSAKTGENVHLVLEQIVELGLRHQIQSRATKGFHESNIGQIMPFRLQKSVGSWHRPPNGIEEGGHNRPERPLKWYAVN